MKHTSGVILLESFYDIAFKPEDVWPILANTDWLNRAIGLPPVKYEYEKLQEGGSQVTASAKIFGQDWRWREMPFEWSKPEYYRVRRIYELGLFKESVLGLSFERTETGTRVCSRAEIIPRGGISGFLIKKLVGPKTDADMGRAIAHAETYLRGRAKVALPKLAVQPVNQAALELAMRKLRTAGQPEDNIGRLEWWLQEAPDVEMAHIRPFTMARMWKLDRWDTLRLFLHATRCGLLDLSWEILCPNCRSSREQVSRNLSQLKQMAHCDFCQIQYDAEFDKSVELKFSVNPSIRQAPSQVFCMAGPTGKPHVISQIWLEPGEVREWPFPNAGQPVRLQSNQVKGLLPLTLDELAPDASSMEVVCDPAGFKVTRTFKKERGPAGIQFTNPNKFSVLVSCETVEWNSEILTAARVTNWQEFRDLFVNEVISPNEKISVGFQVILFTDLRGSTAMYQNVGDAAAYSLVRDHFAHMIQSISDNRGTVVKTMGDAVMASFSQVEDALKAVTSFHTHSFKGIASAVPGVAKPGINLALKTGMHVGPCLAVNANGTLDYFGSTVNLAARLVSACKGNDLAVSQELFARPEMMEFISKLDMIPETSEIKFRGFDTPHKVWRLQMTQEG